MADEKKKLIEFSKVQELANKFGTIKLGDLPTDRFMICKLVSGVRAEEYDFEGDTKTKYIVNIEYMHQNLVKPVSLILQVGESCANRFTDKYPKEEYVGKWALVQRTKFNGKYPQFIHLMSKEPEFKDIKSMEDQWAESIKSEGVVEDIVESIPEEKKAEFVLLMKEMLTSTPLDAMKKSTIMGVYIKNMYPDSAIVKEAMEIVEKVLKE